MTARLIAHNDGNANPSAGLGGYEFSDFSWLTKSNGFSAAIRRVTVTSDHSFDDVVAAVYAGLGRIGNFAAALADWRNAPDRESFDAAVQPLTGPSGPQREV
jgi:hypothetical protein